ncbi:hypothetical protein CQ12_34345 [Bradyrhizobium jicamae]|uniref:Uncharacterized protein n=1 Tax=Bradyrhizobium jicamae TaxID=280332 RepID=A0A0R3L9P8_9BRAD|nr:hypothetical protein CQ12_34345 [Bradyrhizobium jicamae]
MHSIVGLAPIGDIMELERHSPHAQRDVARRAIEQKLEERLYTRHAAVEDLLWLVNRALAGALPAAVCGEGTP